MPQAADDDGKGLVEMVMDLLGIDPNSIGEDDNLAGMGIDSMQVPDQAHLPPPGSARSIIKQA